MTLLFNETYLFTCLPNPGIQEMILKALAIDLQPAFGTYTTLMIKSRKRTEAETDDVQGDITTPCDTEIP